jgi:DNA-binding transcriptional MerR regulator
MQSGELARLAGISADTLRHYERLGLLPASARTSGYRNYPESALERVFLIRSALSVGFSLSELQTILKMRDAGKVPCHRVRAMAQSKLELRTLAGIANHVLLPIVACVVIFFSFAGSYLLLSDALKPK